MKHLINILPIMFVLVVACSSQPKKKKTALTDFQLTTLTGEMVDMKSFAGKTVFINIWATWCKPCVREMPTIAQAMETLKGHNVVFLFASNEEVEEIERFRELKKFPFDYVLLKNLEALSIQALPATFIFSPEGELVFGEEGFRDWNTEENLKLITQTFQ